MDKENKHPADFVKIDRTEVVVLELDIDNRRLSLGHKKNRRSLECL